MLSMLASPKLTLALLVALGVGVAAAYAADAGYAWKVGVPSGLLVGNLLAAIASYPRFRRDIPLLVFHLALLGLVLLAALGRMTYLKGHLEVLEGEEFNGKLVQSETGPWYPGGIEQIRFSNLGFRISYDPGPIRVSTQNRVRWQGSDGRIHEEVIGDSRPMVIGSYRFYANWNKGFAPTFLWHPKAGGGPVIGAVHLPSYPANEYSQSQTWQLPGTNLQLWTMLQFDEMLIDPDKPSEFRLPDQHRIVMRFGELRRELQQGEAMELPQGRLVYVGLRTWMGYQVFYDWTIYWLLGTSMVAVGALGWHFWRKFAARPWEQVE